MVGAGGAALIAAMGGYALAKYDFRGRRAVLAIVLGATAVPGTALAVPTYMLFAQWGLINTEARGDHPGLGEPVRSLPDDGLCAATRCPDSMIEAARIDGAGEGRIFWTIALPLMAPGFVTVLLFQLVATWNNYFLPLIVLNQSDKFPLTVGLSLWNKLAKPAASTSRSRSIRSSSPARCWPCCRCSWPSSSFSATGSPASPPEA